jgi:hypothetical protein
MVQFKIITYSIMHESDCICHTPPFSYLNFDTDDLGIDKTNGRFAEVSIQICKHCKTKWLNYLVETEGFSGSIKWFKAVVPDTQISSITPENAANYIKNCDWYFYGGSYYGSQVSKGSGEIYID